MPIRFRCQDCRSRVKVPEGSQGKQVKCPRCGRIQPVPKHHANQSAANQRSDGGVSVHTCVGSIHRAPKRKEALVGAGASADRESYHGGGSIGGGSLDIPESFNIHDDDTPQPNPQQHNGSEPANKQQRRNSRKERRRLAAMARQAQREREAMAARDQATSDDDMIAETRRQVRDLFATHSNTDYSQPVDQAPADDEPVAVQPAATPTAAPEAIAFNGKPRPLTLPPEQQPETPDPVPTIPQAIGREPQEAWSFDFTREAYPFLRIIPWVLRITALMLIGPAFKVMLVANDSGFSTVVSLLILFAGLSLVVVTWTVGEIAHAVRDIALRKAATQ